MRKTHLFSFIVLLLITSTLIGPAISMACADGTVSRGTGAFQGAEGYAGERVEPGIINGKFTIDHISDRDPFPSGDAGESFQHLQYGDGGDQDGKGFQRKRGDARVRPAAGPRAAAIPEGRPDDADVPVCGLVTDA